MHHKLVSDQLTVLINLLGAEVRSIKDKNDLEFIWTADKEIWGRHAPVLFPIVGKLKDNQFIFKDQSYSLGQHGFARDMEFVLISGNEQNCVFELKSSPATRDVYPFDFSFRVIYQLKNNELKCSYHVNNPSEQNLLFSVGAHPGFNCPLKAGEELSDYYLLFEKNALIKTTLLNGLRHGKENMCLQDKKLRLSNDLFNEDALVFEGNQINTIGLFSSVSSHSITMRCEGWPYFGIWSKPGTSGFICLEPWHGIADSTENDQQLQNKTGIITLAPGLECACSYSISVN